MRRLIAILLISALILSGCAGKGNQTQGVVNSTLSTLNQTQHPGGSVPSNPPPQNNTSPPTNPPANPPTNTSQADKDLQNGLSMFDFTVDPLISDSGYSGTIPK